MTEQHGLAKRKLPMLEMVFIMLFSVYYLLPSVNSGIVHFSVPLILGLLYTIYVLFMDKKTGTKFILYIGVISILSLAYLSFTDASALANISEPVALKRFASKFYQYFCMYLPLLFFSRIMSRASRYQKKWFLLCFAVLFVYVVIQTLQLLAVEPDAIRKWEQFDELAEDNIGSYYFVYSVPVVIVILAICLPKLNKFFKIVDIAAIVFLFYFIIKSQYTLALLISGAGLLLRLFLSIKQTFLKMIFIIIAFFAMFFVPDMLLFVAIHVESVQMATRLLEIYEFLTSGSLSGYNLSGRITLYGKSIVAFLKSPIWGNRKLEFDGHATCFTVLADTGIIGGIPFYYLLTSVNNQIKERLGENRKEYFTIFFCMLLMGFTNPIHSSLPLALTTWFIAPLAIEVVYKKEKNKY